MTLLQQNWAWISSNGWGAATLAVACVVFGWGAATLFYQERMTLLKERQTKPEKAAPETPPITSVSYPSDGRHGKNVLANSTDDVIVNEPNSFRAVVPPNSRLHIKLEGSFLENPSVVPASWSYAVGPINWTANRYEAERGGRQSFVAEGGTADLKIFFGRPGEVRITAFEGESPSPSWTKTIRVRPKVG